MQREKRTKSGRLLEIDFYPVFSDGRRMPTRKPKATPTTEAQARYNHNQAVKKAVRLINENFDTGDILMHPTYRPEDAPQSEEEAKRDFANYIRRVKTKRAAELKRYTALCKKYPDNDSYKQAKKKLEQPFVYYCALEEVTYKSGRNKGRSNWHFHLFMTGGVDRDTLEDVWPSRARVNADRFQPERFGPEAAAKYITKDLHGQRKILRSKNLRTPKTPQIRDGKITAHGVERLVKLRADDREYWERKFKGYRFVRTYARYNEYNGHWYLSVVMYKTAGKGDLPPWEVEEWIDE